MTTDLRAVPPLAAGTRLLHIGIPKTGTTALQTAAAQHRAELLQHGVCYPGQGGNHREAICALMERRVGWTNAGGYLPDIGVWERLLAEVEQHRGRRVFLSHEFASESDDEQARRFRTSLGESIHVVVTFRGFASLLSSSWQQYVKGGRRQTFERWLHAVLDDGSTAPVARAFSKRNDQAQIVDRWVRVMGADRVTVVIADKRRPHQLTDAFEDLLGLPRTLLRQAEAGGLAANRSMSLPEAELIRRLNSVVRNRDLRWQDYTALVSHGAVARMLEARRPAANEPKIVLPRWAAEKATEIAQGYAAAVAGAGCRVVGDPTTLFEPVASGTTKPPTVATVPMDAAVEALAGMMSGAVGQGAFFDPEVGLRTPLLQRLAGTDRGQRWLRTSRATPSSSATDLLAVAGLRAAKRLRSRIGR